MMVSSNYLCVKDAPPQCAMKQVAIDAIISDSGTDVVADCSKKTGEHCISHVD